MKEGIVQPDLSVQIVDSPIPKPEANEVLVKVHVSGMNPKDWKRPKNMNKPHNSGDDIAGTIAKVGANVTEFKVGDRVAAFHVMMSPNGSFAEYAIAPYHTTFHIPASTSYEEAATIPLAAATSACGLFVTLGLPLPWEQGRKNGDASSERAVPTGPVVIYGAASAIGAFAIQFAKRAGIGPLICIAGRGIPFVEGFLDKKAGDVVVDYRNGDDAVVDGIKKALNGQKLKYAFDGVTEKGSFVNIGKVIDPEGGRVTGFLPNLTDNLDWKPKGVDANVTWVGSVHDPQTDWGHVVYRWIAKGLVDGWFKPHPTEVIPGGLAGLSTGLKNLSEGKASAVKYVFRIPETEGAGKD